MSRARPLTATVVALAFALTGCSGSSGGGGGDEGGVEVTASPAPSKPGDATATITLSGSSVSASSQRVKAKVGKAVVLFITADKAGELHVHSTPEQHVSFPKGTSVAKIAVKQPGVIDVEDHALDKLILKLEVR